jgi:hypothetical protein
MTERQPTDAEKLTSVLKLAFNNERSMYDQFCEAETGLGSLSVDE